jgi:hypothetical protein
MQSSTRRLYHRLVVLYVERVVDCVAGNNKGKVDGICNEVVTHSHTAMNGSLELVA